MVLWIMMIIRTVEYYKRIAKSTITIWKINIPTIFFLLFKNIYFFCSSNTHFSYSSNTYFFLIFKHYFFLLFKRQFFFCSSITQYIYFFMLVNHSLLVAPRISQHETRREKPVDFRRLPSVSRCLGRVKCKVMHA